MTALGDRFRPALRALEPLVLLLARLTVGLLFLSSGWGKVRHVPKLAAYFVELGIPAPAFNAHLVSMTELVCGALLTFGLFTRLAALPLIVTMTVAIISAKRAEIHGIIDLFGVLEFAYIVILAVLVVFGPGRLSIDGLRSKSRPHA